MLFNRGGAFLSNLWLFWEYPVPGLIHIILLSNELTWQQNIPPDLWEQTHGTIKSVFCRLWHFWMPLTNQGLSRANFQKKWNRNLRNLVIRSSIPPRHRQHFVGFAYCWVNSYVRMIEMKCGCVAVAVKLQTCPFRYGGFSKKWWCYLLGVYC